MNVITSCHFDRPDYTKRSLAALRRCHRVADWVFLPHVEPGSREVREMIQAVDFIRTEPVFNATRFGVNNNTALAIIHGINRAGPRGFVLHVEDDILLAPDALDYFAWAANTYRDDQAIFSVTAYNRNDTVSRQDWYTVGRRKWFHAWGWGTWPDRWPVLRRLLALKSEQNLTWDCYVNAGVEHYDLREIYPALSRCQNIGLRSSVHPSLFPPSFYRKHHRLKTWAGEVGPRGGTFCEQSQEPQQVATG